MPKILESSPLPMFREPVFFVSRHARAGSPAFQRVRGDIRPSVRDLGLREASVLSRAICGRGLHRGRLLVYSSTSFANPAVTLARCASDTFAAGIRPLDASGFIAAQLCGAAAATLLFRWLVPSLPKDASDVLVPHRPENGGAR